MPGAVWKARTANLGASMERCKEQVIQLQPSNFCFNLCAEIHQSFQTVKYAGPVLRFPIPDGPIGKI
jgi:hypothetical protein